MSALRTAPSKSGGGFLPRLRCLEDYATYSEHVIGDDGKENKTGPLVNGQGLTYEFKSGNLTFEVLNRTGDVNNLPSA